MPNPYSSHDPNDREIADRPAEWDHMDDEEKVMANRPDANIPAMLTRDVLGG